jgi:hypothetical protein
MPLTRRHLTGSSTILGIAALAAVLSGCGVRYAGNAAGQSSPPNMAQAALARFIGTPQIPHGNWMAKDTLAGPRLRTVIPGLGIFEVDASSYQITEGVFDNHVMAADGGKTVSVAMATARVTAAQYAAKNFPSFAGLAEKEGQLDDHGAFKEYSFTWQARQGDAWLPTFVHVTINAGTAGVNSYSAQVVALKVATRPNLSESQARSAAIGVAHLAGQVSVDSENLQVLLEPNGAQKLAYVYELSVVHAGHYVGLAPGDHVVQVDALTGQATQVAS